MLTTEPYRYFTTICRYGQTIVWNGRQMSTKTSTKCSLVLTTFGLPAWPINRCNVLRPSSHCVKHTCRMEIIDMTTAPVAVSSAGLCTHAVQYTMKILCTFEVSAYPFDTQNCAWNVYTKAHVLPTIDLGVDPVYNRIASKAIQSPGKSYY